MMQNVNKKQIMHYNVVLKQYTKKVQK